MKRFLELLLGGRFFLILQLVVSKTIPARWLRLGKSAYFLLDRSKRSPIDQDDTLEIRRGGETDVVDLVRDLYGDDESVRIFYEEFCRNGIEPWIAKQDGKVTGVVWLFCGHYIAPWQGYDGFVLRLEVEPEALFVANVFVAPECRGRKIFPRIVDRFLAAYSHEPVYSEIDEANDPSIKAHNKIGFRRCGATYYIQLFGRTRALLVPRRGGPKCVRIPRGQTVSVVLSPCEKKSCKHD